MFARGAPSLLTILLLSGPLVAQDIPADAAADPSQPDAEALMAMPEGEAPPSRPPPRVAVYPAKAKGGRNLKKFMRKMIEKPLKAKLGELNGELVPGNIYKRAAKKSRVNKKAMATPVGAQRAGEKAGLTHVLIIEGTMEKVQEGRKKKKYFFANALLVEVKTGDVFFTQKYELAGKKMTADIGDTIVFDVAKSLEPPPAPPPPPEEEVPPPPPDMPPPPPEGEAGDVPPEPPPVAELEATEASAETELPPEEGEVIEEPPPEPPMVAVLPPVDLPTVTEEVRPSSRVPGGWRPGMHIRLGGYTLQRTGTLNAPGVNTRDMPCYCGRGGATNPFFPAGYVGLELYPVAFGGDGSWYEGFGIAGEGFLTQVKTTVDDVTGRQVKSTLIAANGGLVYRFVFWDSIKAPDFKLKGGFQYYAFPLAEGAFPGVKYSGPYAGGDFTIPLGTEYISLLLGGHFNFIVLTSGKTKRLGTKDSGNAFRAQGGLRANISIVEIEVTARFEQWTTKYTGTTTLDSVRQFDNVTLTDRQLGGYASVGVHF